MDITPLIPKGKKIIGGYGNGGFTVAGERLNGSLLVLPDEVIAWNASVGEELSLAALAPVITRRERIEILLLGSGKTMRFPPSGLETELRRYGIAVDVMDTGAACRTYNVLLSEERRVAAALIAV